MTIGHPRRHLRETTSTNEVARGLAAAGAPHGTLVTAGHQTAGRGRQGRTWTAPAGQTLLLSLVLRDADPLLPLRAGLAVADLAGDAARVKWPNDVLLNGRKVAGVLVEGRPQEGWTVVGIGVNVALDLRAMPEELQATAGSLGRAADELEPALAELLGHLERRLAAPAAETVAALRERDALLGRAVAWAGGEGTGAGIDERGCLRVQLADGSETLLDAGEVRLVPDGVGPGAPAGGVGDGEPPVR
jgi:BirA family transcriptional regulator, biotin operon repressor / biotin---[acetyl-CoA-carboxylase] ligase